MFCTKCGKQNSETAKFCAYCGQPLVEQKKEKICPKCQQVCEPDMLYCNMCGTRLISNNVSGASVTKYSMNNTFGLNNQNNKLKNNQKNYQDNYRNADSAVQYMNENLLASAKNVSMCLGEKSGLAKEVGTLKVFVDRIEFKKSYNATAGAFGLLGYAVSNSKAKKEAAIVLEKDQIASVKSGKIGPATTLTVAMKDGNAFTFVSGLDYSGMKKCAEAAERYII